MGLRLVQMRGKKLQADDVMQRMPRSDLFFHLLFANSVQTALGAEETVDWEYFKDTPEAVDKLRQEGYTVCAVEQAEGSVMLDNLQLDKTKKYAIVMGNEVKGVQQNVVDNCDICIEIPQYGTKHSLNVSVTTGIVIWDFFKQLSD